MNENQDNLSFSAYYEHLKKLHLELRDEICKKLNVSEKTFYNKLNSNSFSPAESHVILELLPNITEKLKTTTAKVA